MTIEIPENEPEAPEEADLPEIENVNLRNEEFGDEMPTSISLDRIKEIIDADNVRKISVIFFELFLYIFFAPFKKMF